MEEWCIFVSSMEEAIILLVLFVFCTHENIMSIFHGRYICYAYYFNIPWKNGVLVPFLGKSLKSAPVYSMEDTYFGYVTCHS